MGERSLPTTIEDEARLEDLLARPSPADVAFARTLSGDVVVLGAGGKMGPSLARRVRRACEAAGGGGRVVAVSRFSEPGLAASLEEGGVEAVSCDLLDPDQREGAECFLSLQVAQSNQFFVAGLDTAKLRL